MADNSADFGEQALSKAAEVGLAAQLDEVESLTAEVEANPISLIQGELEAVNIQGQGLVMQDDLRIEQLKLQTDGISIDPLKAAFGDIELTQPTHATAEVALTENDIERAFNSDYIHQKLQGLKVKLNDRSTQVSVQYINFSLTKAGRAAIATDLIVHETKETQSFAFSALPEVGPQGYQVVLKDVQVTSDGASEELKNGILTAASELLDLRTFALDGGRTAAGT